MVGSLDRLHQGLQPPCQVVIELLVLNMIVDQPALLLDLPCKILLHQRRCSTADLQAALSMQDFHDHIIVIGAVLHDGTAAVHEL
ncbi:hypothetical protein D3C73_1129860 [compost metagenome]